MRGAICVRELENFFFSLVVYHTIYRRREGLSEVIVYEEGEWEKIQNRHDM